MRTKNSIKNIAVSLLLGFLVVIVNFIAQRFLITTLGVEYAGLNSLFANIVSMLSVAELGLGAAIVYHLYKPIHENDIPKISSLMRFYKTSYKVVALVVVILGCFIAPFIPYIIGINNLSVNIMVVFGIFVINVVTSYLLSYKRSLLYADQKNYIINVVHSFGLVVLNILQILILISTQNFYLYLVLKIIITLAENIILNYIVDKKYTLTPSPEPVSKELRADIFKKINGLVFHKIGTFLVLGSSTIIISTFLGVVVVGVYSNYLLIQVAIMSISLQVQLAIKSSVGNLMVEVGGVKSFLAFNRLQFANQALSILIISVFFVASGSFIKIWLGEEFAYDVWTLAALSLNIYLILLRTIFGNFKEAAGIFYEDRFVPLIESAINIIASIILIQFMGIAGAFIGTALSSFAIYGYSYPKFVYKGIFGRSYREYTIKFFSNFFVALIIITLAYGISNLVNFNSQFMQLMSDTIIAIIVPVVLLWALYHQKDEYLYFMILVRKLFKKLKRSR